MTQQNETTQFLQSLFNKAGAPFVCEAITSTYLPDVNIVAVYMRREMPDRAAIIQMDVTDTRLAQLKLSFKRIGIETVELASISDFEAVYLSQKPTASFVAVNNLDLTVASTDGVGTLYAHNSNEAMCVGLHNVTKTMLVENGLMLVNALRAYNPNNPAFARALPQKVQEHLRSKMI